MICRFVIRICLHSTLPLGFCRFGCQFPQSDNLAPLRAPAALVSAVLVVNSRKVTTFGVSSLKMTNIMFRIQTSVLRLDAKSLDSFVQTKRVKSLLSRLFFSTLFLSRLFFEIERNTFCLHIDREQSIFQHIENNSFFKTQSIFQNGLFSIC